MISPGGELLFIDEGDVTVTVTDALDARFTEKYKYKVSNNNMPTESLRVNPSTGINSIDMDGGTLQMVTREYPSGKVYADVTYNVGNERIATIDADTGLLTAVSNGSVFVTATDKKGILVPSPRSTLITITNQT